MTYQEFLLGFMGAVGMMTLYMGAQAVVTRERAYWQYAAYALCWLAFFFFKVLWTFADSHIQAVVYPFSRIGFPMLAYIFYFRFADTFLGLRQYLPRIYPLFRKMQIGLLAYAALELAICLFETSWTRTPAHEVVHSLVRLAVAVASVIGIRHALRRPDTMTNYFATGSAFLLVGALLAMGFSFSNLDTPIHHAWDEPLFFLNIGILAELLCFSLGLSYKHKQTEIQKLTIEQEILREREQRTLEQLRTQFFTNISHEFRTPLSLILGPLTDLLRQQPANPTYQLMQRHAARLLTLVNQLLDLSKLDAGQLQPHIEPGNLTTWLRLLITSFESLADSRDIQLTYAAHTAAFDTAYFDRDKLEKITTNLLANALKFTPSGGQVQVTLTAAASGQAVVQVSDTGPGIPADQQVQRFQRFHQVPTANSAYSGGTGIGLALVQELVGLMRGRVSVASTTGQGTTFVVTWPADAQSWGIQAHHLSANGVTLPAIPSAPSLPATEPAYSSEPLTNSLSVRIAEKPLLLIVEDNPDVRQYIQQVMTDEYRVVEAANGREGLAKATYGVPDLVICDWLMPELDGMGFCQALKTQATTDHIPVIMLTAKASTQNRIEGYSHGADEYLIKPFHPDELRARARNLLAQRQKLRERFGRELVVRPSAVPITSVEEQFLHRAIAIVEQHVGDSSFMVEQLAEALNMSRMQLHRKLKAVTNQSATEFVRHLRLQRAADLLAGRSASVSEVAFAVGFESLSYFSKSFRDQFGVLPSEYGLDR